MGLFSAFANASASLPHGYQNTGLWACCFRYGLEECTSLLVKRGLASRDLMGVFLMKLTIYIPQNIPMVLTPINVKLLGAPPDALGGALLYFRQWQ